MVAVKFNDEEKDMLEQVVAAWNDEAADMGNVVTASSLIRGLVRREWKARGLDKPGKTKKGTKR